MPATPKEQRSAPTRIFEDYTLTRIVSPDAGLVNIPSRIMKPLQGSSLLTFDGPYNIGQGYSDDASSVATPIGFNFEFDGVVYTHFFANTNGWLALLDPEFEIDPYWDIFFAHEHVLDFGIVQTFRNLIKVNNTSQTALLAPWFDSMLTVSDTIEKIPNWSIENDRRVKEGLAAPPLNLNESTWGVRVYYDCNCKEGRRTIVRWNVQSAGDTSATSVLIFEVVLYENGKIEFRYVPKKKLKTRVTNENATIGIFMPGSYRFRDFAPGLGYRENERVINEKGGATYIDNPSFIDIIETVSKPYVGNLKPDQNWPGLSTTGCILSFQPPQNRRKILPRSLQSKRNSRNVLPTIKRTGDKRPGTKQISFDDRRSVSYVTGTIVNYPTTFQPIRGLGNSEPTTIERLDLYAGGIEATGSVGKTAIEQYLEPVDIDKQCEPFDEANRFEQGSATLDDGFFSSGSVPELGQSLRSKTQIRFSLPINITTEMFGLSSSIYYYNAKSQYWNVPRNTITETADPLDSTGTNSDIQNPRFFISTIRTPEDARGFGPVGNTLSSGSNLHSSVFDLPRTGTDAFLNKEYTTQAAIEAIQRPLEKSISKNSDYDAINDETFTVPINEPFVLEKATIEIPFAFGESWFEDKTTSGWPFFLTDTEYEGFDFGGPGITVSLFNQLTIGNNKRRDLILTGTITHEFDDINNFAFNTIGGTDIMRKEGFRAFGVTPSTVVSSSNVTNKQFTGSIQINTEALVSNGVMVRFSKRMNHISDFDTNRAYAQSLIDTKELVLSTSVAPEEFYGNRYNISYINPIGRGQTSFEPAGRSIFGKEYLTSQTIVENGKLANPFYLDSNDPLRDAVSSRIDSQDMIYASTILNLEASERSPYLLHPGDKLVLAVSKTRPWITEAGINLSFTGSHDVKLITGSVNITLYGSLLRENKEVNFSLNQNLASDAIHEAIGSEAILDEYEVFYRDEYIGSTTDNFITGSMVVSSIGTDRVKRITTGSRGRVFSKYEAREQVPPETTGAEALLNPSKNYRLQPWYERAGTPRLLHAIDYEERYWDSMMPSLKDVFEADGTGIWIPVFSAFGDVDKVNQGNTGYMIFDYQRPTWSDRVFTLFNGNWTWAYPYEPRYSQAPRQQFAQKSFVATQVYDDTTEPNQIAPRVVENFIFGPSQYIPSEQNQFGGNEVRYWLVGDANIADTNQAGYYPTGSAGTDDAIRALYGFGDRNSYTYNPAGFYQGTKHFADFHENERSIGTSGGKPHYTFKPIIRGWKYGVQNGLPEFSKMYFKRNSYGQFRDTLEQRPFARYYKFPERGSRRIKGLQFGPVEVKFVDAKGNITAPENTSSQNLSQVCTSSFPYLDGHTRNRNDINQDTQNTNIVSFDSDEFNNISIR